MMAGSFLTSVQKCLQKGPSLSLEMSLQSQVLDFICKLHFTRDQLYRITKCKRVLRFSICLGQGGKMFETTAITTTNIPFLPFTSASESGS